MPRDMYRWEALKNGHYGWHNSSPEYAELQKSNDALSGEVADKIRWIVGDGGEFSVGVGFSQGTIKIGANGRDREQMGILTQRIADGLEDRFAGSDPLADGVLIYFYGIDPAPFVKKWEKRTGYQKA